MVIRYVDYATNTETTEKAEFVDSSKLSTLSNYDDLPNLDCMWYMRIDVNRNIWQLITGYSERIGVYIYRYSERDRVKRIF